MANIRHFTILLSFYTRGNVSTPYHSNTIGGQEASLLLTGLIYLYFVFCDSTLKVSDWLFIRSGVTINFEEINLVPSIPH